MIKRSFAEKSLWILKGCQITITLLQVPVEWGIDLGSEHERYLAEKAAANFATDAELTLIQFQMRDFNLSCEP